MVESEAPSSNKKGHPSECGAAHAARGGARVSGHMLSLSPPRALPALLATCVVVAYVLRPAGAAAISSLEGRAISACARGDAFVRHYVALHRNDAVVGCPTSPTLAYDDWPADTPCYDRVHHMEHCVRRAHSMDDGGAAFLVVVIVVVFVACAAR